MRSRRLGDSLSVSAVGLGCMGMSFAHRGQEEAGAIRTLRRAVEIGVTFFDTAEVYGPFENEKPVGKVKLLFLQYSWAGRGVRTGEAGGLYCAPYRFAGPATQTRSPPMKPLLILGAVLIVAGVAILLIGQFDMTKTETLVQVGDAAIQAETTDTVALPPMAGFAAIGVGVVLVVVSRLRRS